MDMPDESIRVLLTRMEGKLDLSNMRHDQTDARLKDHETRLHRHSNDISSLQAKALISEGKRQGLLTGGKVIWAGIGTIFGGGGIAVLVRIFGG